MVLESLKDSLDIFLCFKLMLDVCHSELLVCGFVLYWRLDSCLSPQGLGSDTHHVFLQFGCIRAGFVALCMWCVFMFICLMFLTWFILFGGFHFHVLVVCVISVRVKVRFCVNLMIQIFCPLVYAFFLF